VTGTVVALLAALGSVAVVGVVGLRRPPDVLAVYAVERADAVRVSSALDRVGRWPLLQRVGISRVTEARLGLSGTGWRDRQVVAAKGILVATAVLSGLTIAGPVLAIPAATIAWRIPDIVLARLARRTVAAADREIPVLLDLLAVATSAGLPPQLAFRRAVDAATGPLAEELGSVINASDLGGRWRDELNRVGERLDLPDLRRLLGSLARTDAVGSSLAEEVANLASDVREVRRAAAAQRARTAPVKMLFPLVFLVLPAFLLLTVVPVLLTTVRSIS
jgi:Flp pilus assembly protein TadB